MINTDRDITLFNLRYDSDTRRETFIPTNISGVSLYDVRSMQDSSGNRTESSDFKIRIPVDAVVQAGRTYIPEYDYAQLSDDEALNYWTIQKGCYILTGTLFYDTEWLFDEFNFRSGVIIRERLEEIQSMRQYDGDFITVKEYADNTQRGSKTVQHWRIGGD